MINYNKLTSVDVAFYKFANKCFENKFDVVFKGGCVLRHIMRTINKYDMRKTQDIDFDVSELAYLQLEEAFSNELHFGKIRMGCKTNITLLSDDIACDVVILPDVDLKIVRKYDGLDGPFLGVRVEDILADKIAAMSGPKIITRAKDLCDIYSLVTSKGIIIDYTVLYRQLAKKDVQDFAVYRTMDKDMFENIKIFKFNADDVVRICSAFTLGLVDRKTCWNGRVWL